jgi:hypothetical protein
MIFLKQKNCCRVDLRVYMHTRPAGLTDGLEKKKENKKLECNCVAMTKIGKDERT